MRKAVLTEILQEIQHYSKIIIHRHERPDPDALGSQAGLAEILHASFPEKSIYKVGGTVNDLDYLTTMDEVADDDYEQALVIVTDTANAPRISDKRYALGEKVIKIDHHPNDEPYGEIVWVDTNASSCSEMIYEFYAAFPEQLVMTDEAARLLYGGIVGDTGRFMYPSTTPRTMEVAAALRRFNFDATLLNRQLDEITENVARLSGYALEHLEIDEHGAARIILPHRILEKYNVDDSETSSLIPLPGQIDRVQTWALFVEQPEGYYRVRIRSKGPVINTIAKEHKGGGHPLASGATARDLEEVNAIYQKLSEAIPR
ncbi:bifunctional oligoribonuclease/PAP phosphatase NrnA [Vagococcus sp.]|uniref:DHH family phosphoesterase n=1 Tax=Vagococcus sp. TaxID=1933889 RepID=UPI000EE4E56A|nr:bifunctional oligoribonuclease/PAP phosphatase NrnA [Vagococcus sp.]HCT95390.1 DHH family phosphoesterase [Vagococcus sp.]